MPASSRMITRRKIAVGNFWGVHCGNGGGCVLQPQRARRICTPTHYCSPSLSNLLITPLFFHATPLFFHATPLFFHATPPLFFKTYLPLMNQCPGYSQSSVCLTNPHPTHSASCDPHYSCCCWHCPACLAPPPLQPCWVGRGVGVWWGQLRGLQHVVC